MAKKRRTDGYGRRIAEAMERGPRPIGSVRGLARRFENHEEYKDLRGTSYGGVRQYVEGNITRPRTELLHALADVLDVRFDWLAYGDGEMTEDEAQAAAEVDGISLAAAMTMKRSITEELGREYWQEALELRDSVLKGWAGRGTVAMTTSYMPHWVAPLAALRQRLDLDAEELGEVLAAPLRALDLDPADLNRSRGEPLATYIIGMVPVLMALAPERESADNDPENTDATD